MTIRRCKQTLAGLGLLVLASCNGETLAIGSDEPDEPRASCTEPWPDDESNASPDAQHERRAELGVGRWFACKANPTSAILPPAFDVTEAAVYPLRESDEGYVREPALPDDIPYSVRAASLVMTIEGVQFKVQFRDTPRGMTLRDQARTHRFVR